MALVRYASLLFVVLSITACKRCTQADSARPGRASLPAAKTPPAPALFGALFRDGRFVLVEESEQDPKPPRRLVLDVKRRPTLDQTHIARLAWSLEGPGGSTPLAVESNPANLPLYVAVTAEGLYLLDPEGKPADIRRAVKRRPDYTASPQPIASETRPDGRYVLEARFNSRRSYCFGEGPPPHKQTECEDVCDGMICFAEGGGIVHLSGNQAPEKSLFSQTGFEML
jgi:hypothetical protein